MKLKKIITIFFISTFSFTICSANNITNNNSTIKEKTNSNIIYNNNNEPIFDISKKQYKKIKWEKPYIAIQQFSKEKIEEYKTYQNKKYNLKISDDDINKIYNNGISGDFISIKQIKKGNIKTDFGEYELIWVNDENNNAHTSICNNNICSNDLYLKEIDNVSGLLYGKFNQINPNLKSTFNINKNDFVGMTRIKIKDFFKSKPSLNVHYKELNENNNKNEVYKINYSKLTNNKSEDNSNDIYQCVLNDSNKTSLNLIINKNKSIKNFVLLDGTMIYSKKTDNNNIVDLFYLDFDNNKNPNELTIYNIGKVFLSDINNIK